MTNEILYTRELLNRLSLWRADLRYQKRYLSLQVDDLLASHKATLSFIHGMGVNMDQQEKTAPIMKLKRCILGIMAVSRMKIIAQAWKQLKE